MISVVRLLPIVFVFPFAAQAQVPNGSFENWADQGGFSEPIGWITLNALGSTLGMDFAEQGIPGAVGISYLELITREVPDLGTLPSVAFTGSYTAEDAIDGFPFTQRPAALTGQLKFAPEAGDVGTVIVSLTRWDPTIEARAEVSLAFYNVTAAVPTWTAFTVPLTYADNTLPDTASITLLSSSGENLTGGTVLSIDDLQFAGSATGIAQHAVLGGTLDLSPNPATTSVVVTTPGETLAMVALWGADGKLVHAQQAFGDRDVLNTEYLQPGTYVVRAFLQDGTLRTARMVKQ